MLASFCRNSSRGRRQTAEDDQRASFINDLTFCHPRHDIFNISPSSWDWKAWRIIYVYQLPAFDGHLLWSSKIVHAEERGFRFSVSTAFTDHPDKSVIIRICVEIYRSLDTPWLPLNIEQKRTSANICGASGELGSEEEKLVRHLTIAIGAVGGVGKDLLAPHLSLF